MLNVNVNINANGGMLNVGRDAPGRPRIYANAGINQTNKTNEAVQPVRDKTQNAGILINISKAARVFHDMSLKRNINFGGRESSLLSSSGIAETRDAFRCVTCENRAYEDKSSDPSVSFQTATNLSPAEAGAAVAAHEGEHIRNERENAENNGREVVAESVSVHTAICPECKRVYVSGGKAETLAVPGNQTRHTPLTWAQSLVDTLLK